MKYKDLLDAHLRYGTTKEDLVKISEYESILENVVIAPWWEHTLFEENGFTSKQDGSKVYTMTNGKISFSFIELKEIGAPVTMEYILSLGVTKCKNVVFLGSAGALDNSIKIGDIVIPEYSICGDGATRYLNENLEDEFGKKEYPSKSLTNEVINTIKDMKLDYHIVPNYSTDTVFGEFFHLDKFVDMGCKTIEMETANLFKCGSIMDIDVTAIFCISDNIVLNKSLYSGRSDEEKLHKRDVKHNVIPNIVINLFDKLSK